MRALTVQQPWAWAIVHGGKDVENRTQAWGYRGPLAIHAGARWSDRGATSPVVAHAAATWLCNDGKYFPESLIDDWAAGILRAGGVGDRLTRYESAIIGVVDLVDVHTAEPEIETDSGSGLWAAACCDSPWAEQSYDEHGGRTRRDVVHLVLENPRPLATPIPARGRLGLWTPDVLLLEGIREQVPA